MTELTTKPSDVPHADSNQETIHKLTQFTKLLARQAALDYLRASVASSEKEN